MKTNSKKYIVMSLVLIAICLPILFLIVFLVVRSSGKTPTNNTLVPESFPISYSGGSEVDIDKNVDQTQYKYALITDEDFILLKNDEKELYVNLEMKKWKEISFSPSGKLVAVLGESTNDIYDVFVYSIKTKKWTQGTQYSKQTSGIQKFTWVNDSLIYYIQGEDADRWIHSYNYESGEIIKLKKVDGDFASSNYHPDNIVIDNIDRFTVYDKNLNLVAEMTKQQILNNGTQVLFTDIFADYGEKFYLYNENQYYKYSESASEDKISPKEFDSVPLCQISENAALTIVELENSITTYILNLDSNTTEDPHQIITDSDSPIEEYRCIENSVYFFINSSVYNIDNGSYNLNNILKNSVDFDIL